MDHFLDIDELSLEEGLEQLELIARRLEKGEDTLAQAIELFEHGARIYSRCQKQISELDLKITKISRDIEGSKNASDL